MKIETAGSVLLLGGGIAAAYLIWKNGPKFFEDIGNALSGAFQGIGQGAVNIYNAPSEWIGSFSTPEREAARIATNPEAITSQANKQFMNFTPDYLTSGGGLVVKGNEVFETKKTTITGTPKTTFYNKYGEGMSVGLIDGKPVFNAPNFPAVANILETPKLGYTIVAADVKAPIFSNSTQYFKQTGTSYNTTYGGPTKPTSLPSGLYSTPEIPLAQKIANAKTPQEVAAAFKPDLSKQYPYFNLGGKK